MLALVAAVSERFQKGSERLEQSPGPGEIEAPAMIGKGLRHFGLCNADLAELPKGDPRKLAIAWTVRNRSAGSNRWLAEALSLGHASRLSHATIKAPEVLKMAQSLDEMFESKT